MRPTIKLPVLCLCLLMFSLFALPSLAASRPTANFGSEKDTIVRTAERYLKTPYRFGGDTPKGFDCSGFVKFVYDKNGAKLPRTTDAQYLSGQKVVRTKLQPGDLVFFNTYAAGASHVGIYYGNDKFIHASSSKGVMISRLDEPYWKPRYLGARRISVKK
ncbi:C40 family peptidase [Sporomusa aerivorans]|uniref:C40 family peptidase n=1 Tax=Sporomusa aerivorans TaxID=204936 RepID=UPI00352AC642